MEELSLVSSAMTSRIKASAGDCVAICNLQGFILKGLMLHLPGSAVQLQSIKKGTRVGWLQRDGC